MNAFFRELRRRKVVRVAIAYAAAAFVTLQLADLVIQPLGLPAWVMTLVIVFVGLGAVPALVLAWAFEWTPQGVRRESAIQRGGEHAEPAETGAATRRWPLSHRILMLSAATIVGLAGVAFLTLRDGDRAAAVPLDSDAVAVMPFRLAVDPSLAYLGHGMVDLLAAKLTGEGGPRAVDTRTVLRLWDETTRAGVSPLDRQGALALARGVGAGQLLLGEIVGGPGQITLSATLHDVASRSMGTPATAAGPVDSLPALVDRIVAQLLSTQAGEAGRRLDVLTSASLPALRAYLAGKDAYRGGRFSEAATHFRRAVEIDSTFALAGLELRLAAAWSEGDAGFDLGTRVAWQGRDRLPPRERRRLELSLNPSFTERLAGWEALVREDAADPVAWFFLGELLFHAGPAVGHPDALERALHAFERAVAIDSIYAPALYHAIEIHAHRGDTAQVRRLAEVYFDRNAPEAGLHADYIGWRTALALNDEEWLASLRAERFGTTGGLPIIAMVGQTDALPLRDVELALDAFERRAGTTAERSTAARDRMVYLLNAGRPAAAERTRGTDWALPRRDDDELVLAVRAGTFWDGDATAAAAAATRLEARLAADPPAGLPDPFRRIDAICALEERRLAGGDASRTAASVAAVRAVVAAAGVSADEADPERPRFWLAIRGEQCAAHVGAWGAAIEARDPKAPAVATQLATLDSLLTLRAGRGSLVAAGNLIAARLHAARGDTDAALRAIRRRGYWGPPYFLSTRLLEEARLAERAGDVDGALRAYAHYLHLRADPEPALRTEVEAVRGAYERLREARAATAGMQR